MTEARHVVREVGRKDLRAFGLITGVIILGVFGLFIPWSQGARFAIWPWLLSTLVIFLGLIAPLTLRPLHRSWMTFGLLISRITNPLIMCLVFLSIITPAALLMKILGKDALKRQLSKEETTYRVASSKTDRDSIERPY